MLQEAAKIITSAIHNGFVKKLSLYLHDCVREEVQSSTFRNLKQDKDNKWIFLETDNSSVSKTITEGEKLFTSYPQVLKLDGSDSYLTELMLQGEKGQKDKYLIYGYLFLVGKNSKAKRKNEFLTPLLYCACDLKRTGLNIECSIKEEGLSLNTAALTSLMNFKGEEDEIDNMLDGLLEVVPKLPLNEEDLQVFLTTLKSLIPDLEFEFNQEEQFENNVNDDNSFYSQDSTINFDNIEEIVSANDNPDNEKQNSKIKAEKVVITNKSAIILTKRPLMTAGVLYELTQIADRPSGEIRETALSVINEEYIDVKGKVSSKPIKESSLKDFTAVTPLSLSDSQEDVIKNLEDSTILSVYGPPGTGKSQTIVNLICHLISNGKTVLVASRMDKATDVVAERLNGFGAPYLALRAGRANYQKQLSFDLEDLISNKVDLDTGFENSIIVDVEDMHKLIAEIRDKEQKCEDLIKLETEWHDIIKERDEIQKYSGENEYLTSKLTLNEVETVEAAINDLEKNFEKKGFFSNISVSIAVSKLRKIINNKNFKPDIEYIEKLKSELNTARLSAKARLIETKMNKIGNIHILLNEIKTLKRKQKTLAIDILKGKRRNSLKSLLRDQIKRQRLIVHTKALVTRKQNLQNRLLEDEDFTPLLDAFPCWCVTTYAVSNSLPLKPALFDVAIIDEASQCDIASCIPVLYRCKKAVIVGDDKQLPHLSFLEKSKEQSFLSQYEIPDKYQLMWRFRTNSMFDLANYYSTRPVLLDEHFRSAAPIIDFSNKEFYGNRIRIMTKESCDKTLELVLVKDGKADSEMTRNMPEVEAVMQKLQEIIQSDDERKSEEPVSIGIISPFRGQVELIKKALAQLYPDSVLKKHKIEVGTAHTFQGDERDIMMLSWAVADNSFNQSLTFLQIPNLFNVAITRARKKQIIFLSKDPKSLPQGLLRDYIQYVMQYVDKQDSHDYENSFKNPFEKEVAKALISEGYTVITGVKTAGLSADLTVTDKKGNSIIIECDGVEDSIRENKSQIKKQTLMERTGMFVERVSYREWYISSQGCIERIKNLFEDLF